VKEAVEKSGSFRVQLLLTSKELEGEYWMQDTARLWQAVLGEIELTVSRGNFVTWFKSTQLLRADSAGVVVGCPNIFIKQQLEKKYQDLLVDILDKNGIRPEVLEFKIYNSKAPAARATNDTITLNNAPQASVKNNQHTVKRTSGLSHKYRRGINDRYTFENFIVGSGNELAYAACQAIATKPGQKYNPLFLYGGVGIGKTHLMQAVGNEILKSNPNSHVVYISTEQFVQEFLDAIRYKKNTDFADHYRSADVLIVDDIQFIAGKEKTQEEFFHTFNALHQANKQIIISSDKPPKDIPTLEERLRSRFAWGMSIDMQIPDFETRCAIIQTKAHSSSMQLPADVTEFLANLVSTNIRELEGVLNQLLAFCEMRGLEPELQVAQTLLGSEKTRPKHISPKHIVERTARYFSIPMEDLLSPKRDKDIVYPRQIAMYLLRNELHMSFPKIAIELGRKDHTTAIHSVDKIEKSSHLDPSVRQQLVELRGRLYA
jgi:chromosomal replication initiator protein